MALILSGILLACASLFHAHRNVSAEALTPRTWDGGGATNNWSEAANWAGDSVPGAGDDVTFDATSTKNATIDVSINVGSIAIGSGYTGTVTQSNAASIQVSGCSGRPCFRQDGGTFNGSTNTITLDNSGSGGVLMTGGTFIGGSGNISLVGTPAELNLQGGTFTSTSGNLTTSGILRFQGTAVFQPGGGTVTIAVINSFAFMSFDSNHPSVTFNNLVFNNADGANFDILSRAIVTGNLTLNDGTIGSNGATLEARGPVVISPNFDGGNVTLEFGPSGAPRTQTFATGINYPKIRLNDPNLTVNTSGSGTLLLPHQLIINQGTFNQGAVDLSITPLNIGGGPCLGMNSGTFNGSSHLLTLTSNGFGTVLMSGGVFNGGSGDIIATGDAPNTNHDIQVNGGVFKSTTGTLFVSRAFRFQNTGAFLHNGGTVVFNGGTTTTILTDDNMGHSPPLIFNNLIFNRDSGSLDELGTEGLVVNGTLSLNDGAIGDGGGFRFIEARGNVNVASTFDGLAFRIKLLFSGAVCQTVTLNGTQTFPGSWEINKNGCAITGVGNFGAGSISVINGSFVLGSSSHADLTGGMTINPNGRITVSDNAAINAVNGQIGGDLDISGVNASVVIDVSANVSPSGNLDLSGANTVIDVGGSVTSSGDLDISGSNGIVSLGSLTVNPGGQFNSSEGETIILGGDVVNNGLINLHAGSVCSPAGPFVVIQSSVSGTQRNWSGSGVFRLLNAGVRDMAGSALIKVHGGINVANNGSNWTFNGVCQARALHAPIDFDGDEKSDVAMFRPSTGEWWLNRSTLALSVPQFGLPADKITPADFDGDGITDVAVWRESSQAQFFILQSETDTVRIDSFGVTGDDPGLVGDWDGDGKAEPAVYRNGSVGGQSFIFFRGSSNNPSGNIAFVPWGTGGDFPVRGDFDGDGRMDPAVFRSSDLNWWINRSLDGQVVIQRWGLANDKRIDGDFDADGKTDFAVFRPSDGSWYVLQSSNGQTRVQPWGVSTDIPLLGDYDGDGKADFAIWRPSDGNFWILRSGGTQGAFQFGTNGDIPVASVFVR